MIANGCIIRGTVENSIIGRGVTKKLKEIIFDIYYY